jgi:hypothetical protein
MPFQKRGVWWCAVENWCKSVREACMFKGYLDVLGGTSTPSDALFRDYGPTPNCRGEQFVKRCTGRKISPPSESAAISVTSLSNEFHDFLQQADWRWVGGVPGGSYVAGARLLDGAISEGECAAPAYALAYLLNAPLPWGWGKGWKYASVVEYKGASNEGFISRHTNNLPGPTPNVIKPDGDALADYYVWANHKVVQVGNEFYDPNYRCQYTALSDMGTSLVSVRKKVRLRDLEGYNTWTFTGLARMLATKLQDLYWSTDRTVDVYRVIANGDPNINGYYFCWEETWKTGFYNSMRASAAWYGPYPRNPLVR